MTAANISTGRGTRVAIISESVFGVTPDEPAYTLMRPTRSTLRGNITKGKSAEFTTDRNTRGDFMTAKGGGGRIEGELHHGSWSHLLESAFCKSWATNVLKTGQTAKSCSIEETYELGKRDEYDRFVGCMVDVFDLTMAANDTIKVGFDIMARELISGTTPVADSTYPAATSTRPPATTESISAVTWGGLTSGVAPLVISFSLKIANNLRKRPVWDDARSINFGMGMADVTGEVECYFDDYRLYQEIYTQSTASLSFKFGTGTNTKFSLSLPLMSWGDGELSPRERDGDITLRMPFTAHYETEAASSVVFNRAVN